MALILGSAIRALLEEFDIPVEDIFRVSIIPGECRIYRYVRNEDGKFFADTATGEPATEAEVHQVTAPW